MLTTDDLLPGLLRMKAMPRHADRHCQMSNSVKTNTATADELTADVLNTATYVALQRQVWCCPWRYQRDLS